MGFTFNRKLPIPKEIKADYPLSANGRLQKEQRDREIRDVITGADDRFLIIVGPCSADNETAVMDYLHRLVPLQEKIRDKCIIIPRIYTNKPRTTGETGLTAADEMLYPENWWYLTDLLSYVAVGARSVEDQHHRMTVSGFDVPAGMKNPTSGHMSVMLNSVVAAQHAHSFIYRGWDVDTTGNPLAHTILRGAVNKRGAVLPNYHYEDLRLLSELYAQTALQNPACIVDVNHSNSNKQYLEQIRISKEILNSRRYSDDIHKLVKGLMIESYIEDGCQGIHDKIYGKSITDPCLGWEESEQLLYDIAEEC